MVEVNYLISKKKITYEGLFDAKELYKLMDQFWFHLGFDKSEKKHAESVKPEGKYIDIEVEYYKKESGYVQVRCAVRLIMQDLKEVEVKKEKAKVKLNKGRVQFIVDGYMETDWEGMWETKPLYYVIRTVLSKWVLGSVTGKFASQFKTQVGQFMNETKAFLNLYRY